MFETVVPSSGIDRRRPFSTAAISVGLHLAAVVGAVIQSLGGVTFPIDAPRAIATYRMGELTPPPPPPAPPAPRDSEVLEKRRVAAPTVITAPSVVPETIPEIEEPIAAAVSTTGDVEGGIEGGVEGGVVGGLLGGTIGGLVGSASGGRDAQPAVDAVSDSGPLEVPRHAHLPLAVIWKPYPDYPLRAQFRRIEDELVVRYVVGKNGKVKSVTVIEPPRHEEFARATVMRLREWRFRPLLDANGKPREVVHELLVRFRLTERSAGGSATTAY